MKKNTFDDSEETKESKEEEEDSPEDSFAEGFEEDEEVVECAECGSACPEERRIITEIEGEKLTFCSKHCSQEYKESVSTLSP